MIRGFIFDLDGTLADTIDDIGWSINCMLADRGFPTLVREEHLAHINNGAYKLVERSIPEIYRGDESFVRACLRDYESYYSRHYDIETYAYPGVGEAIASLSKMGYALGVLSNKQDAYVKSIIKKLFGDISFALVCGQVESLPTKPDPTAALLMAKKMGLSPSETAFVGDSPVDIATAKNAGMYPVGVAWGYRSAESLRDEGARRLVYDGSELLKLTELCI